jgi:hypothetical protein
MATRTQRATATATKEAIRATREDRETIFRTEELRETTTKGAGTKTSATSQDTGAKKEQWPGDQQCTTGR